MSEFRTGIGWDVHRLVAGRPLVLGGVRIPCDFGLEGHSDADVLSHAITDAILGAAGGPFAQSQPNLMVQLPNGAQVNAGLVAQIYTHGYPQSTINQMIAQIADTPAPVSS